MEVALIELVVILALIMLNGVFSGAEIALVSLRRTRVDELVGQGRPGARWVAQLVAEPERLLATVQIGITVIGSTAAAFGGSSLSVHVARILRPGLGDRADEVALAVVIGGVSYLSLVLGELVPKSLALRSAESYALFIAPALAAVAWVMRPLVWVLTTSSNVVLRLFGDRTSFTEGRLSSGELRQLVDEAATAGTVDVDIGDIAARALGLSELDVADVLVPRSAMVGVHADSSVQALAELALSAGHSRVLVYGTGKDDIRGYLHVRDVLAATVQGRPFVLAEHLHPVPSVPPSMTASTLLRQLQARRGHLAVVVDAMGVTRGLVTLEDLLEEVVGDILSERDPAVEQLVDEGGGRWLIQAGAPLHDLNRVLGVALPDAAGVSTLGGLVTARAQRIPEVGEHVWVDGMDVEVVAGTIRRLKLLRVTLPSA